MGAAILYDDETCGPVHYKEGVVRGYSGASIIIIIILNMAVQRQSRTIKSAFRLFVVVGLLVFAHAAYSAAQHRLYLRITEREFTGLPADIVVQIILAFLAICCGLVNIAGDFREIKASKELENKSWETFGNQPSFYTFTHRGRVLFSSVPELEDEVDQED
ncbi:ER membrane protein complex subunit 5-like isoform X1 [Branchiostoma floridae x Branchiostoma japonicum]